MSDIVTRLWGNTGDKYPGFQNINTEAAAEITRLREELKKANEDIETMQAGLEKLSEPTLGPAILSNLCEAARYEIGVRINVAEETRKNTHVWRSEEAAVDAIESEARDE